MKTVLKPCPFCGSEDIHYIGNDSLIVWYYCEDCDAVGPSAKTKKEATKLWNKRKFEEEKDG